MLETYLNSNNKSFLSWEKGSTGYSFLGAIVQRIHGSKQLDRKARKILKNGWENVKPLNSFGKVSGQNSVFYIKHQGSGIRAPFFQYNKNVFIGIFVFYKSDVDEENKAFEIAVKDQRAIKKWIQENEELYKKLI